MSNKSECLLAGGSSDDEIVAAFEQIRNNHPDICARICNKWVTADAWVLAIASRILFPPQILCNENFNRAIGNCPSYQQNSEDAPTRLISGSGVHRFNFLQEWFYYVVDCGVENVESKEAMDEVTKRRNAIVVSWPNPSNSWVNKLIRSEDELFQRLKPLKPCRPGEREQNALIYASSKQTKVTVLDGPSTTEQLPPPKSVVTSTAPPETPEVRNLFPQSPTPASSSACKPSARINVAQTNSPESNQTGSGHPLENSSQIDDALTEKEKPTLPISEIKEKETSVADTGEDDHPASVATDNVEPCKFLATPKPTAAMGSPPVASRTRSAQKANFETPLSVRTLGSTDSLDPLGLAGSPLSLTSLTTTAATPMTDSRIPLGCQIPGDSTEPPQASTPSAMASPASMITYKSKSRMYSQSETSEGAAAMNMISIACSSPVSAAASKSAKDTNAKALEQLRGAADPNSTPDTSREDSRPTEANLDKQAKAFPPLGTQDVNNSGTAPIGSTKHAKKRTRKLKKGCKSKPAANPKKRAKMSISTLKAPQQVVRNQILVAPAPLSPEKVDAIRNIKYFESSEARTLFGPEENETVPQALQRRIELLRRANSTMDGWRDVISGGDPDDLCDETHILRIRQKSQYLCKAYMMALNEMDGAKKFFNCCEETVVALSGLGLGNPNVPTSAETLRKWNMEFKKNNGFVHPNPKKDAGGLLITKNPAIRQALIDYCIQNLHSLAIGDVLQYMKHGPIQDAYEDFVKQEQINERERVKNSKNQLSCKVKPTTMDEWLAKFKLKHIDYKTIHKWMSSSGFRYNKKTKQWSREDSSRPGRRSGDVRLDMETVEKENSTSLNGLELSDLAFAEPRLLRCFPSIKDALLDYCRENFKTMQLKTLYKYLKDGAIKDAYQSSLLNEKDKDQGKVRTNTGAPTMKEWLSQYGYHCISRNTVANWAHIYGLRRDKFAKQFYFIGEESEQYVISKRESFRALYGGNDDTDSGEGENDSANEDTKDDNWSDAGGNQFNDDDSADGVEEKHQMHQEQAVGVVNPCRHYPPLHSPIHSVSSPRSPRAAARPVNQDDWAHQYDPNYYYQSPGGNQAYGYRPYSYNNRASDRDPQFPIDH